MSFWQDFWQDLRRRISKIPPIVVVLFVMIIAYCLIMMIVSAFRIFCAYDTEDSSEETSQRSTDETSRRSTDETSQESSDGSSTWIPKLFSIRRKPSLSTIDETSERGLSNDPGSPIKSMDYSIQSEETTNETLSPRRSARLASRAEPVSGPPQPATSIFAQETVRAPDTQANPSPAKKRGSQRSLEKQDSKEKEE